MIDKQAFIFSGLFIAIILAAVVGYRLSENWEASVDSVAATVENVFR
jgi:uncharacterized protein YpmB